MPDDVKLTLFFRRIPLGVLERTENGYRYTSYIENEQKAVNDTPLLAYGYRLQFSSGRESPKLFPEFMGIIDSCSRKDILEQTGISPQDHPWEKLVKLSAVEWLTTNLYVQQAAPCAGSD